MDNINHRIAGAMGSVTTDAFDAGNAALPEYGTVAYAFIPHTSAIISALETWDGRDVLVDYIKNTNWC